MAKYPLEPEHVATVPDVVHRERMPQGVEADANPAADAQIASPTLQIPQKITLV
jgi:hypothetical protein